MTIRFRYDANFELNWQDNTFDKKIIADRHLPMTQSDRLPKNKSLFWILKKAGIEKYPNTNKKKGMSQLVTISQSE